MLHYKFYQINFEGYAIRKSLINNKGVWFIADTEKNRKNLLSIGCSIITSNKQLEVWE